MRIQKIGFILVAVIVTLASLYAEDGDVEKYCFPNMWEKFNSLEEIANAKKERKFTDNDLRKEAVYYFSTALNDEKNAAKKSKMVDDSLDILNKLWRKDNKNNLITLLLGYSYTAQAAISDKLDLKLRYVFRARNLYGIVIERLPENISPRLARAHININLTPLNGRPDDILIEDAEVYLTGYPKLPEAVRNDPFYKMGKSIMNLALAVIYWDQNKSSKGKPYFEQVDAADFPASDVTIIDLYNNYKKKYK